MKFIIIIAFAFVLLIPFTTPHIFGVEPFVDTTKDPWSYIDRYNNEPSYKEWFDANYPEITIFDAVGLKNPLSFVDTTKDPWSYIDRYNNEPSYKEWFDANYPEYTIYEGIGLNPNDSTKQPISSSNKQQIPDWIKSNAKWWSDGQIDDQTFVSGIEFLVKEKIVNVPVNLEQISQPTKQQIPDWIKSNAKWWSDGQIDDQTFVSGIEFLVKQGIVHVDNKQESPEVDTKTISKKIISHTEAEIKSIVKTCTRDNPSTFEFEVTKYISESCLIENAKSTQDCLNYQDLAVVEFKTYDTDNQKTGTKYFEKTNQCVQEISIKNKDPTACQSLDNSVDCIINYVNYFPEPETCLLLPENDQITCVSKLIENLGTGVCNSLHDDDKIAQCVSTNLGENPMNSTIKYKVGECKEGLQNVPYIDHTCRLIPYELEEISKDVLLSIKSETHVGGYQLCVAGNIPNNNEPSKDQCQAFMAIYFLDHQMCESIENDSIKDECYGGIARTDDSIDESFCDSLTKNTSCYANLAYRLNDKSMCDDKLSSVKGDKQQFRNQCILFIDQKNK